jgi:hypothetical protein
MRPSLFVEILQDRFIGILDTGSGGGLSLPLAWVEKKASELDISLRRGLERTILGRGILHFHNLRVSRITIGGLEIDNVRAEAVSSEKGTASDQSSNWTSVGNTVLRRLQPIGINCKDHVIILGNQNRKDEQMGRSPRPAC